jgi:hypothetical protein
MTTEKEILELEETRCAAMIAGDVAALQRMLHEEMIYTHSSGSADTKTSLIEAIRNGKFAYKQIDHSKERVRFYGDTALVSGQAVILIDVDRAPRTLNLCYLAAWTKTPAGWQFVALQSASIPT